MIGRGAIRNPWLFRQIREHQCGEAVFIPRGADVLAYVRALYEAVCSPAARESAQVQKMKKYMNYLGVGVEPTGQFLHQIRRVTTTADLFRVCRAVHGPRPTDAAGTVPAGTEGRRPDGGRAVVSAA